MKRYSLLIISLFLVSHLSFFISAAFAQTPTPVQSNLNVTAFIGPQLKDFQFAITSDKHYPLAQEQVVTYEITYGSKTSAAIDTTNTIVVDFSDDRAPDGTHVVDYIIGSATKGYNNAQPVVDLTARTITWTITNLPAGTTDQKLTFRLNTNSNYTTKRLVHFTATATMSNEYVTMPEQVRTHEYRFDEALVTPAPTVYVTPTAVPTPTPTPAPPALRLTDISFRSISDDSATISMTTNRPAKERILWGTTPSDLTQRLQTDAYALTNSLTLSNLTPNTQYYFRVIAFDTARKVTESELFTFTTARTSALPELSNNSIVIATGGTVLLADILSSGRIPAGMLTSNAEYQLTYTFNQPAEVIDAYIIISDATGSERIVALNSQNGRMYTGTLRTGEPGTYNVFVRLTDKFGNVIEQHVARIKALTVLQVREAPSNLPIADARIKISKFNAQRNRFEILSEIKNPAFTDREGKLQLLLPPGQYQADTTALGYTPKTMTFTLGEYEGQDFPIIYLTRDYFNFLALLEFLMHMLTDTIALIWAGILMMLSAPRSQAILIGTTVGSFALLSTFFFTFRTDIRWRDLWPFFLFHLFASVNKHKHGYIFGIVINSKKQPVSLSRIEVIDLKTGTALTHAVSNKSGRFIIKNTFQQQYIKVLTTKDGYAETDMIIGTAIKDLLTIVLKEHKQNLPAAVQGLRRIFGELFELSLLVSLLAELLILLQFGITTMLPYFLLSIFNLCLWIFFQREKKL